MRLIPPETLDEIRSRVDLASLVADRGVALKRTGSSLQGLCPFHGEKSPSFDVSKRRQTFKCFGCGAQGDAFAFVMQLDGVSFVEAARDLAAREGVEIPDEGDEAYRRLPKRRSSIIDKVREEAANATPPNYPPADEVAALWDAACSVTSFPRVVDWLNSRGIDPAGVARHDLARVVVETPPEWARWAVDKGARVAIPLYDWEGRMRSFKFRARGPVTVGAACIKSLGPFIRGAEESFKFAGLTFASPLGVAALRGGPHVAEDFAAALGDDGVTTLILEGETDYLYAASRDDAPLALGLFAGTWSRCIASAIPRGTVIVATDPGDSGEGFAREVRRTLRRREDIAIKRWRPRNADHDYSDAGGLAGGIVE